MELDENESDVDSVKNEIKKELVNTFVQKNILKTLLENFQPMYDCFFRIVKDRQSRLFDRNFMT